ncbi:MAG TPA: tol-pal system protein YbgF [Gemmatimonadaceae bacterium]|jgi:tol-pal system protein YbgF
MTGILRRFAPVALLATGACFATRQDVQLLQTQMQGIRSDAARSDSAQRAQLAQVIRTLAQMNDSLEVMHAHVVRIQGDIRGDLYGIGQQLIQIQELTGQSQRRLQELRASLDQRSQDIAQQAGSDSGGAASRGTPSGTGASATPGPNQLFQLALDQLRRGSPGAAQTALQTLLQQYPTADVAPDAQFYLGESYKAQGNTAAADTAYMVVMQKYPTSPRASTALYKHALFLEQQGNTVAARAALNDLIQKYPRSDEAALAKDHLRTMK